MILDLRKHAGEDLQTQILLVTQPVGAALEDPDLIVHPFDESQGDLIVGVTIRGNPVPMAINQRGKLLIRPQALPLQGRPPILKEAPRPAFLLIVPQLAEGLLEQVGGVQPLVRGQQDLQAVPRVAREIRPMREQRVLLPLDVAPVFAAEPPVLGLAHGVEGVAQMAHDVKLVEQDRCLRCMTSW